MYSIYYLESIKKRKPQEITNLKFFEVIQKTSELREKGAMILAVKDLTTEILIGANDGK